MKKAKKLTLSRETLINLENASLREAAGGSVVPTNCPSCETCTYCSTDNCSDLCSKRFC